MNERQNILFCLPSISRAGGGVSVSAQLQAEALGDVGGVNVSVFTFRDEYFEEDLVNWGETLIQGFNVSGPRSYSFSLGFLVALLKERPDVIHVHGVWQFHCLAVYIWSIITGRPYIVTPHGMLEPWIRKRSPKVKSLVSKLYQDKFLKRASAFQLLTEKEKDDVQEYSSRQSEEVIPNYVPDFDLETDKPVWWQDTYLGKDIYFFLGRIHEKKGCLELCDAWGELCTEDLSFKDKSMLVFCGWNDGLNGFEGRISDLHEMFGNVLFAGPQYGVEKNRSISVASFFVLPSKSEGLPMAVLEAWSAEIPVIMTEECNLPIGFSEKAAFRTGTKTTEIVESLKSASHTTVLERNIIVSNALGLIKEKYSANAVGSALKSLYSQVLHLRWEKINECS